MNKDKLIEIVREEYQILRYPIFLMLKDEIEFKEETACYEQDDDVGLAVSQIITSVSSSVNTILLLASLDSKEMVAKDLLLIARSVIEGCINSIYIMSQGSLVAKSALEHSVVKGFRNTDRVAGKGKHQIKLKQLPIIHPNEDLTEILEKFTSKKGKYKNWTDLSVPQRIEAIEPVFGRKCAVGLASAYLIIYSDASEIVHGSVAGAKIANGTIAFGNFPRSDADHTRIQELHIENTLLSSFLSMHCFLDAFCQYAQIDVMQKIVNKQLGAFEKLFQKSHR
jgi:hypothetical protein